MDLQLHRITRLIRDHHTVLPWKAIHVAGTNGKGTTAAFLAAFLYGKGLRVGRFNSPHLKYRHDCIVLNEQVVDKDLFLETEILIRRRDQEARLGSTSFELLTATAFELFAQQKVDVAVVECGLGGRLDATNVLLPEEVLCSAITRVSLDHQDLLGNSVEKIAAEKAGIIKAGVPVVVDRQNDASVLDVVKTTASALDSPLFESADPKELGSLLDSGMPDGVSARDNLAVATRVYGCLNQPGRFQLAPLTRLDLMHAMTRVQTTWKGRLQWEDFSWVLPWTGPKRYCLLDGAHNSQAAAHLRAYVDQALVVKPRPLTWIIAMSASKDVDEVMSKLIRPEDRVAVCEFAAVDGMPWVKPHSIQTLKENAASKTTKPVIAEQRPLAALRSAFAATNPGEMVVVAGSLYLIGELLREAEIAQSASQIETK